MHAVYRLKVGITEIGLNGVQMSSAELSGWWEVYPHNKVPSASGYLVVELQFSGVVSHISFRDTIDE